ncbi:MAG TPA: bifunctional 2-polyprenyl-6-hydroxyphenol methylase/3-demethylubiquinol 3-O-methyltransferase UbiG [Syntrophorhabdaceae bacterium]|jgi:2-polyprenyl-6-hydroxyphenyl methylase/3-demethylubiquinone-9 3-methyltransferase
MEKTTQPALHLIDNAFYNTESEQWWEPGSALYLMKTCVNPVRVGYGKRKLLELGVNPAGKLALEVGCGGGVLCEEIGRMGFSSVGIDLSVPSLRVALNHSRAEGMDIGYAGGRAESLPCRDNAFDVVFCCDVLEHVASVGRVISEISRVLRPGGVFFYDTLNRTLFSKLVAIKISQEWKRWSFMPDRLHVWTMFVRPEELKLLLAEHRIEWKEHRGIVPGQSIPSLLRTLRKRVKGQLSYRDLGARLSLVESDSMKIMYMGYGIKK